MFCSAARCGSLNVTCPVLIASHADTKQCQAHAANKRMVGMSMNECNMDTDSGSLNFVIVLGFGLQVLEACRVKCKPVLFMGTDNFYC